MSSFPKVVARRVLPAAVWTSLRLIRIRASISGYRPRQVHHICGGVPLKLHIADPMAEGWYDHDWPEQPELLGEGFSSWPCHATTDA